MTAKWRLVATLNSRAREAMRDRREIVETKPPSEYFVGVQARYMGKAIAYKDAARLVAEAMDE